MAERLKNEVLSTTTLQYLDTLDPANLPVPHIVAAELMEMVRDAFEIENSMKDVKRHWKYPEELSFQQLAHTLHALHSVRLVACAGEDTDSDYDLLGVYLKDGKNKGIYDTSERAFRILARQYEPGMDTKKFNEMMTILKTIAPRVKRCSDPDLIAVNNGIFNYKTKKLQPFTPELVFLSKSRVDYHDSPPNPNIYNSKDKTHWNVADWMEELSDDPEIVNLLWEILGAIIRPHVRWNKSAWLYSERGNNGKGTLCELMRNLCGDGSYASIPISDFGKDFLLEPLIRSAAIIVDENDVGTYIDKAANLKAVITSDVIQINRKHKKPIAYQFYGFMVQCLNEMPRIKDKSDSFYRRQLFIPMEKCFTGHERRYIKNDYLHRPEVLQYVLHRVLNMNFYELSEPEACTEALNEYKEYNDPVRQFWEEISPQFVWDIVPSTFLHSLYVAWYRKNYPSGTVQGRNTLLQDIQKVVITDSEWDYVKDNFRVKKNDMDKPEPLILDYDLNDWKKKSYTGNDPNVICNPTPPPYAYGLKRRKRQTVSIDKEDN